MRKPLLDASKARVIALALASALASEAPSAAEAAPRHPSDAPERFPAAARYLVNVGTFEASAPHGDASALSRVARDTLVGRLAANEAVVLGGDEGSAPEVRRTLRLHRLRGYFIDGRVRVVSAATASLVEVSLIVQTHPEREYRFESSATVTLSGGASAERDAELRQATRRVVASAAARALGQIEGR